MADAQKRLIDFLQQFGLSINACKAYVSLLKKNPATGYEISVQSAIPRSAIYAMLNRLEAMGLVNSEGDTPKKYIPLAPSSLIDHLNSNHSKNIKGLESAIDDLELVEEACDFWHIHGYNNLIIKLKETINHAKKMVLMNAWAKEVQQLEGELANAVERGVKVILFSFCKLHKNIGNTISYNIKEEKIAEIWYPKIVLVVDHNISIMGSAKETSNRAIWTSNEALTKIAMDYTILDITLAGQRLGLDVSEVAETIMQEDAFDLDKLIAEANQD
ncbi:TrmB family transcriptional regulator [Caldithrix abyssi]|nr:TrmB family transcriptional regulator [Caldithrix abyssi]